MANQLQRCGQRHVQTYAADARVVLGKNVVGYLQGRRVVYRDLRSDHRWTIRWPTSRRPLLAMYGRRLIVASPLATGGYALYQAAP
jgi:hypothetical protein